MKYNILETGYSYLHKKKKDAIGVTWEADPVRADDRYYWNGEIDNPKAMEDEDAKDKDGNQIYVQVWNPETEAMEDTEEKLVTRGLKYKDCRSKTYS